MSAWHALQDLQVLLGEIPTATLPAGRCSIARPVAATELPAIAVAAAEVVDVSPGLGGLVEPRRLPGSATTTASRCSGVLLIELWTADAATMNELAEATVAALAPSALALAQRGFSNLGLRSIGPSDSTALGDDDARRMSIACAFAHEVVTPASEETEGLITTVHVEFIDELHEVMDIP